MEGKARVGGIRFQKKKRAKLAFLIRFVYRLKKCQIKRIVHSKPAFLKASLFETACPTLTKPASTIFFKPLYVKKR